MSSCKFPVTVIPEKLVEGIWARRVPVLYHEGYLIHFIAPEYVGSFERVKPGAYSISPIYLMNYEFSWLRTPMSEDEALLQSSPEYVEKLDLDGRSRRVVQFHFGAKREREIITRMKAAGDLR